MALENIYPKPNTFELLEFTFGQKFIVDYIMNEIDVDSFDALVIPGGFKNYGYYKDAYSMEFLELIRDFRNKNKIIGCLFVLEHYQ